MPSSTLLLSPYGKPPCCRFLFSAAVLCPFFRSPLSFYPLTLLGAHSGGLGANAVWWSELASLFPFSLFPLRFLLIVSLSLAALPLLPAASLGLPARTPVFFVPFFLFFLPFFFLPFFPFFLIPPRSWLFFLLLFLSLLSFILRRLRWWWSWRGRCCGRGRCSWRGRCCGLGRCSSSLFPFPSFLYALRCCSLCFYPSN